MELFGIRLPFGGGKPTSYEADTVFWPTIESHTFPVGGDPYTQNGITYQIARQRGRWVFTARGDASVTGMGTLKGRGLQVTRYRRQDEAENLESVQLGLFSSVVSATLFGDLEEGDNISFKATT